MAHTDLDTSPCSGISHGQFYIVLRWKTHVLPDNAELSVLLVWELVTVGLGHVIPTSVIPPCICSPFPSLFCNSFSIWQDTGGAWHAQFYSSEEVLSNFRKMEFVGVPHMCPVWRILQRKLVQTCTWKQHFPVRPNVICYFVFSEYFDVDLEISFCLVYLQKHFWEIVTKLKRIEFWLFHTDVERVHVDQTDDTTITFSWHQDNRFCTVSYLNLGKRSKERSVHDHTSWSHVSVAERRVFE